MVVPYLRNPRRLHSQQQLGMKTTSQYHLEPDHTNTYDTSTYRHVGRRTKGGGGGGYLFSSSNNSSTGGGDEDVSPVGLWIFLIIIVLVALVYILVYIYAICKDLLECMFGSENQEEQQQTEDATQRCERRRRTRLIKSNLHYEVVLSDKGNVNIESLHGEDTKEDDATEASDADIDDGNDSVIVVLNHDTKEPDATCNSLSSSTSSIYMSVRNYLSSWNLRPKKNDACLICLDAFQTGQIICAAKSCHCNQIFHKKCIENWLMGHDYCPLCRRKVVT